MTINQIKYFVAVGDCLNFTRAAEKTYVTQQVISKQIKRLEEELGFPLFVRDKHNVALTEGGELLYDAWSVGLKEHHEIIENAYNIMRRNDNVIKIGIIDVGVFYDWIASAIELLEKENTLLEIRVESVSAKMLYQGLLEGKYDMAVTADIEEDDITDAFDKCMFKTINPRLIVSSSHPAYHENLNVRELADYPLYVFSYKFSAHAKKQMINYLRELGIEPASIEEFDAISSLEMALYSDNGYTLAFAPFFRNPVGKLKFFELENPLNHPDVGFSMVYNKSKKDKLRPVIDAICKVVNR